MDVNTQKKIEELKKNPPNRFLPVLLIPVVMAGVFCYRVATTDPQWTATAPKSATAPAKAAAVQPTKVVAKPDQNGRAGVPAPTATAGKTTPRPTAADDETTPQPAAPRAADGDGAPSLPNAASESDSSPLDAYLAGHLGQRVPFLYKGERRTVTIAAYTEDTVTIKRKKTFTLKRSELSPEQLALWK